MILLNLADIWLTEVRYSLLLSHTLLLMHKHTFVPAGRINCLHLGIWVKSMKNISTYRRAYSANFFFIFLLGFYLTVACFDLHYCHFFGQIHINYFGHKCSCQLSGERENSDRERWLTLTSFMFFFFHGNFQWKHLRKLRMYCYQR